MVLFSRRRPLGPDRALLMDSIKNNFGQEYIILYTNNNTVYTAKFYLI